jgi:hypothetical protein
MTWTRPFRRITLHFSQIFLTLGLTFMMSSAAAQVLVQAAAAFSRGGVERPAGYLYR